MLQREDAFAMTPINFPLWDTGEMAAFLREARTLTAEQVDENARRHDRDDLTPAERISNGGVA